MTIVMGLDQHRAQITAEWIDTDTGEISRTRVAPADRVGVRRFLERFTGRQLEVALEATTGWRFVVEELRAVGARAHLAEPAETSALRGPKKHAKSDRADAKHLRECCAKLSFGTVAKLCVGIGGWGTKEEVTLEDGAWSGRVASLRSSVKRAPLRGALRAALSGCS